MTAPARSTTVRPAHTQRRRAVLDEAIRIWNHLPGPTGRPLTDNAERHLVAGIAPAAACYAFPPEARSSNTVPPWWIWRPSSWSVGHRRDELLLAASLGLAALDAELRTTATLTVVGRQPSPAGSDHDRHARLIDMVQSTRAELVDHDQLDPARSTRPTALSSLTLAAGVYFLPADMRDLSRSGVPLMWAWPGPSWQPLERRVDELATATAMTLAAIEIHDRPLTVVS